MTSESPKKLEQSAEPQQLGELLKLAETTFKTVLDADVHQDNKASRMISAMAFLTAATATIFTRAYPADPTSTQLLFPVLNVDLRLLSFIVYMVLVLIGAAFYLAALGPSLNIPRWLRRDGQHASIGSLLFFNTIAGTEKEAWEKHWDKDLKSLQSLMMESYIKESRLIAQKAQFKFELMSVGSMAFRLSLVCLAALSASLFGDEQQVLLAVLVIGSLLSLTFAISDWRRSQDGSRLVGLSWAIFSAILVTLFIVVLLR